MKSLKDLLELFVRNNATDQDQADLDTRMREVWMRSGNNPMTPAEEADVKRNINRAIRPVQPLYTKFAWAAAASVAIIAIVSVWFFNRIPETGTQPLTENKQVLPEVFKGKQYVRLPDGSTAILSEGSELRQSESFGETERVVTLIGEAYFDIAHDPSRPFRVITDKITTTVLGTAFNVNAFPGQEKVIVTVTRGKVRVSDQQRVLGIITPNGQLAVNTHSHEVDQIVNEKETEEIKHKYLVLDNLTMEAAAATLSERYNVKVIFNNNALKKCPITAMFLEGEDLDQIMKVIGAVIKAEYEIKPDGTIYLSGEGC